MTNDPSDFDVIDAMSEQIKNTNFKPNYVRNFMTPQPIFTGKLLNYKDFVHMSSVFIETGTAAGDGVQRALDAGFCTVSSIEAKEYWYELCKKRFTGNAHVDICLGKSTDELKTYQVLEQERCVIFLDAHPAGPESAGHAEWESGDRSWDQDTIIKAELAIILATAKRHVIIIDDVNGMKDGHAAEYMALIEADYPNQYDYAFYDENLSGSLLYEDKILVAIPKM